MLYLASHSIFVFVRGGVGEPRLVEDECCILPVIRPF